MVGQQRRRIASVFALVVVLGILTTGCKKDDAPTSTPPASITTFNFTSANQSLPVTTAGGATKAKLTGGTLPYAITGAPNNAVATATVSNDTLTVTPVAAGTTSITIEDSNPTPDNPPRVVTIGITVTGTGGGGGTVGGNGSLSFTSTVGNMSASGTYNPNATSGQGVGVARYTQGTEYVIAITGYVITSATSVTVAVLTFYSPSPIVAGSYPWPSATLGFGININPSDPNAIAYAMTSGSGAISAITASNVQGSFSGAGIGTNQSQFTLSPGSFNVNSASMGALSGGLPPAIEAIARRMAQEQLRQLSK